MSKVEEMKQLVERLNVYRDEYYNNARPSVSDQEYDRLYDKLVDMEQATGIVMVNSPTQTVGYEVKSELIKIKHNHPMLSLGKTKNVDDIVNFFKNHDGIAMLKMDGLTCSLQYNGDLIGAETRGNGEEGEDILHNAKVVTNIPLRVSHDDLIVDGEMIIDYPTFEKINAGLPADEKYKNPRNLASGSIRQLDSKIAKQRGLKFVAWKVVKGMEDNDFCTRLFKLNALGFEVVPYFKVEKGSTRDEIQNIINDLVRAAEGKGYPIDGVVFGYSDVAYGESLGMTGHHVRSQIAFKFKDDVYETTLKEIQWSMGKTGCLCPVAIFNPVEIEGTTVERASVHNWSLCQELELGIGDTITVYKANMIIPQIADNLTRSNTITFPDVCPICGGLTKIVKDNDTKVVMCDNEDCQGKLLGKLCHAVSKNALDIAGMSEATLEFMINELGVKSFKDLYHIPFYNEVYERWIKTPGFGKKSVDKLREAIEQSKKTNMEKFIFSLSIPLIGRTASKDIAKYCDGDIEKFCAIMSTGKAKQFTKIDGFGQTMYESLMSWYDKHWIEFLSLKQEFNFIVETAKNKNNGIDLTGKTFVITGSLNHYSNRDELKSQLENLGAKVSGSVSKNTFALICNEDAGSSKSKKAKDLGVQVWTEDELLKHIGGK